jgi:hypothetical protein
MLLEIDVTKVQRGDIVRFKAYWLRVESEPQLLAGGIRLHGRINVDGCPLVTRTFMKGRTVRVEREEPLDSADVWGKVPIKAAE